MTLVAVQKDGSKMRWSSLRSVIELKGSELIDVSSPILNKPAKAVWIATPASFHLESPVHSPRSAACRKSTTIGHVMGSRRSSVVFLVGGKCLLILMMYWEVTEGLPLSPTFPNSH